MRSAVLRNGDERVAAFLAWGTFALMLAFIVLPLGAIFVKALLARDGSFAGLAPIWQVASDARTGAAAMHSILMALATALVVLPSAFLFAFALTRSRIAGMPVLRLVAFVPLLTPSLMPAISLVYLFGTQGVLRNWMGSQTIYGPIGIVLGEAFNCFPHAVLVMTAALSAADARLYEAAKVLGASPLRRFLTITLPNARYGLVSAAALVITLVITDFGVPKVIGGQYNMLALEAYKQVLGRQDFHHGAVVGLMLLLPAVLSVLVERRVARGRQAGIDGRAIPYRPQPNAWRDMPLLVVCGLIAVVVLALLGVGVAAAFIELWPYKLQFTLAHFDFDQFDGGGWQAFYNSLQLALGTALAGTALVFLNAYLVEKQPAAATVAPWLRAIASLPMAVPGLVLGLGYVLWFNAPGNPLRGMLGGMAILVASTVAHYYTSGHLAVTTALRQQDGEIETVARTLGQPWWLCCLRVSLPMALPTLLNVLRYLFVSAMTTVSCVVFLYSPDTTLASLAVVNMDDAGETAGAAAMATLVVATSAGISLLLGMLGRYCERRTQAWRAA